MTDNHQGHTGDSQTTDFKFLALQPHFQPDWRHIDQEMRVIGQKRLTGSGEVSSDGPVIGSGPGLICKFRQTKIKDIQFNFWIGQKIQSRLQQFNRFRTSFPDQVDPGQFRSVIRCQVHSQKMFYRQAVLNRPGLRSKAQQNKLGRPIPFSLAKISIDPSGIS